MLRNIAETSYFEPSKHSRPTLGSGSPVGKYFFRW